MSGILQSAYRLTYDDAIDVWLRYMAGEYQHAIAASYGINPGRINEVLKGHKHAGSEHDARSRWSAA